MYVSIYAYTSVRPSISIDNDHCVDPGVEMHVQKFWIAGVSLSFVALVLNCIGRGLGLPSFQRQAGALDRAGTTGKAEQGNPAGEGHMAGFVASMDVSKTPLYDF